MELRQLEYLVAVAEEANFTRAAEHVHIGQSGVDAQVRQLERELGADLIDRSGRRAALTAAGGAALEHARAALASAAALRRAVDDVSGVVRGRLAIGMVVGCTVGPLFAALASFRREHPGVELSLAEDNSDRLVDGVRAGRFDLALVATAGGPPDGLPATTIVSERLVAMVPSGHPLAARRRVSLRTVARHPVVCLPPGTGIRTTFDDACAAADVHPDLALQASAPDAVADLAARGLGVAVLSETMATAHADDLHGAVIEDARIPALLALAWSPVASPALRELVRHTHEAFGLTAPPRAA